MYRNILIEDNDIEKFAGFIPECYHERLRDKELYAIATIDYLRAENALVGVVIMGVLDSWAQIIWYGLTAEYDTEYYTYDLILERVRDACYGGQAKGIFAEIPANEDNKNMISCLFSGMGFEVYESQSNVLEFPLNSIKAFKLHEAIAKHEKELPESSRTDEFSKLKSSSEIILLKSADETILRSLGNLMANDERPVPVEIPVLWDRYDKDLSIIHMTEDGPSGVVLVSLQNEDVYIKLAYEKEGLGMLKMIAALIEEGIEKLDPDTRILIPVVEERILDKIKLVVPKPERSLLIKAYRAFETGDGPSLMDEIEEE